MYRIRFLNGRLRGRAILVDEPVITIGSAPDCSVRITERGVADCHLQCRHEGRDLVLVRLGAAPVTVNGRTLEMGEALAIRRARVGLGDLLLGFEVVRRHVLPRAARSVSALEIAARVGLVFVMVAEIVLMNRAATESRAVRDAIECAQCWAARATNEAVRTEPALETNHPGSLFPGANPATPPRSSSEDKPQ